MFQLMLLIPRGINEERFHQLWPDFLNHAERMPGLISESVTKVDSVLYGSGQFSRMYTFAFQDKDSLQEALTSEVGEKAGNLIHQCTGGQVTILIAEHRQEQAEQLRHYREKSPDDHE